jgi:hypothetical protein
VEELSQQITDKAFHKSLSPATITDFSWFSSVAPGECRDGALKLGHDHFLPNPFQFIIYLPSCRSTLYNRGGHNAIHEQLADRALLVRRVLRTEYFV